MQEYEAGSRKSYEQIVADKDLLVAKIKELKKELSFNVEELVKSEAEVERLAADNDTIREWRILVIEERDKLKAELKFEADGRTVAKSMATMLEAERDKLRLAVEGARQVFRNSERGARLGADGELIAEALLIGLRGCDKALKGEG